MYSLNKPPFWRDAGNELVKVMYTGEREQEYPTDPTFILRSCLRHPKKISLLYRQKRLCNDPTVMESKDNKADILETKRK